MIVRYNPENPKDLTTADLMIGSTLYWGLNLMPVFPKLPELTSYWERLEKRPAWQKVQESMSQGAAA